MSRPGKHVMVYIIPNREQTCVFPIEPAPSGKQDIPALRDEIRAGVPNAIAVDPVAILGPAVLPWNDLQVDAELGHEGDNHVDGHEGRHYDGQKSAHAVANGAGRSSHGKGGEDARHLFEIDPITPGAGLVGDEDEVVEPSPRAEEFGFCTSTPPMPWPIPVKDTSVPPPERTGAGARDVILRSAVSSRVCIISFRMAATTMA